MDIIGARFERFVGIAEQGGAMSRQTAPTFAGLVQEFFTDYMLQPRALSPRTVVSYRDTFVLLLRLAEDKLHLPAHGMAITDLNARFLAALLVHLEAQRHNYVRSSAMFDWPRCERS